MDKELTFKLISREQQRSRFDWMSIDHGATRVGKVRGVIDGKKLTICSINIFPEFERQGYAKATIDLFKEHFDTLIADRVRYTAIGFWKKMGFVDQHDGTFVYGKRLTPQERGGEESSQYKRNFRGYGSLLIKEDRNKTQGGHKNGRKKGK